MPAACTPYLSHVPQKKKYDVGIHVENAPKCLSQSSCASGQSYRVAGQSLVEMCPPKRSEKNERQQRQSQSLGLLSRCVWAVVTLTFSHFHPQPHTIHPSKYQCFFLGVPFMWSWFTAATHWAVSWYLMSLLPRRL